MNLTGKWPVFYLRDRGHPPRPLLGGAQKAMKEDRTFMQAANYRKFPDMLIYQRELELVCPTPAEVSERDLSLTRRHSKPLEPI